MANDSNCEALFEMLRDAYRENRSVTELHVSREMERDLLSEVSPFLVWATPSARFEFAGVPVAVCRCAEHRDKKAHAVIAPLGL